MYNIKHKTSYNELRVISKWQKITFWHGNLTKERYSLEGSNQAHRINRFDTRIGLRVF